MSAKTGNQQELFRKLPSAEKLLRADGVRNLTDVEGLPHELVLENVRAALDEARQAIRDGSASESALELDALSQRVIGNVRRTLESNLRPVINAAGVVLHTNLGRAPLSAEATAAVSAVSANYNNLEYDLERGERGSRREGRGVAAPARRNGIGGRGVQRRRGQCVSGDRRA